MCSIIGAISLEEEFDIQDIRVFEELFLQSKIRGLHATGLSYIESEKIKTIKEAISGDKFIENHPLQFLIGKNVFIGHCRYSTSDLEFNQPIADEELSIVHNGVVTQEDSSEWAQKYGFEFLTKNDTEIFFHKLKEGKQPFLDLPESSGSVLVLQSDGVLKVFRNGKRPLWSVKFGKTIMFASTRDIFSRTAKATNNFFTEVTKLEVGIVYRYNSLSRSFSMEKEFQGRDLQ